MKAKHKYFDIKVNDIFEELSEENKRLNEELIFANNCLNVLNKLKILFNKICVNFETNIDLKDKQELNRLEEEFNSVIDCKHQKNDTNVEELTKTGYSENGSKTNDQNIKIIELTNYYNNNDSKEEVDTDYEVSDESDEQISDYSEKEMKRTTNKRSRSHIKGKSKEYGNGFPKRNVWFVCDFAGCGKKFKKSIQLKCHITRTHTLEKPSGDTFECEECHKLFKREILLKIHRKRHSLEPNICCDLCDFKTKYRHNLRDHIKAIHSLERPFMCGECSKTYATKGVLTKHLSRAHSDPKIKCDLCDFKTKKKYSLKLHIRTEHTIEEDSIQCDYEDCHKKFKTMLQMKAHIKNSHLKHTIACDWPGCEVRVNTNAKMAFHIRSYHTLEKPFKCQECDKAFVRKDVLKVHQQIHLGLSFECKECHKVCDTQNALRQHKRIHLPNQRLYKCDFCDFESKRKEHLEHHMNVKHIIKEKTFKCDVEGCHKVFKSMHYMRIHKSSIHIRTKTFLCDWPGCDQKYKENYQLQEHKKSHTVLTQYKCDFEGCARSYITEKVLKQHKYFHTPQFECSWPECNGRFPFKHLLTIHMNKHLNIKPFKCTFDGCPKEYPNPQSLGFHLKRSHKQV